MQHAPIDALVPLC